MSDHQETPKKNWGPIRGINATIPERAKALARQRGLSVAGLLEQLIEEEENRNQGLPTEHSAKELAERVDELEREVKYLTCTVEPLEEKTRNLEISITSQHATTPPTKQLNGVVEQDQPPVNGRATNPKAIQPPSNKQGPPESIPQNRIPQHNPGTQAKSLSTSKPTSHQTRNPSSPKSAVSNVTPNQAQTGSGFDKLVSNIEWTPKRVAWAIGGLTVISFVDHIMHDK